jgi:hypothetical protein
VYIFQIATHEVSQETTNNFRYPLRVSPYTLSPLHTVSLTHYTLSPLHTVSIMETKCTLYKKVWDHLGDYPEGMHYLSAAGQNCFGSHFLLFDRVALKLHNQKKKVYKHL